MACFGSYVFSSKQKGEEKKKKKKLRISNFGIPAAEMKLAKRQTSAGWLENKPERAVGSESAWHICHLADGDGSFPLLRIAPAEW